MNIKIGIVFCQDRKMRRGLKVNEFPIFTTHRCSGNNPIFREMVNKNNKEK